MKKSKLYNVLRSTFTGITNSVLLLILNLLSRKLFLQYIGLDYLSVAQVITNLLVVFSFTELGLSGSVVYMLYSPIANGDSSKICDIIYLYRKFNRIAGLAVLFVGMLFAPLLHLFIKTSVPIQTVYLIYVLNLITSVSTYFYSYRSVLLAANQQDYISSIIQTLISFVRVIIQCLLIYITHDYILFLLTGLVATVLQNFVVYQTVGNKYPYIKKLGIIDNKDTLNSLRNELFKNVSSMASVKITAIVINNTDNILVSWINTLMVGLCSNYTSISVQVKNLVTIFHTSLLHSIGIASAEKDKEQKYELFEEVMISNTFLVGLVSVLLGVLWDGFIIIWLGKEYVIDKSVMYSIFINFVWGLLIAPVWLFRDANGIFVYIKKMLLVNAGMNVILSIVLGKAIGISGVFYATVASDLLTDFWYDSNILFKTVFKKKNGFRYQIYIVENAVEIIGFVIIGNLLFKTVEISILVWIVQGVIVSLAYSLFFCFRYYRNKTFILLRKKIWNIVKKLVIK